MTEVRNTPSAPGPPRAAWISAVQQLAGHDDALDLVGALVDLGDRGPDGGLCS
jgi:hypothetical protein